MDNPVSYRFVQSKMNFVESNIKLDNKSDIILLKLKTDDTIFTFSIDSANLEDIILNLRSMVEELTYALYTSTGKEIPLYKN